MKFNNKQRKILATIIYILYFLFIIFLFYCLHNNLFTNVYLIPYLLILVGFIISFICQMIYPYGSIVESYNMDSEMHTLNYWNTDKFLKKLKNKYALCYEEVLNGSTNVIIRKFLKVSGIYSLTKNKTLVVIEIPKITLNVVDLIEKIKKEFKENIPKQNFFNNGVTYRLDIIIITEEMNEDFLQYISLEILSTIMVRGMDCVKSFSIPIVINKHYNKLYIPKFNDDSFSRVIFYSKERKKIRKKLEKYK